MMRKKISVRVLRFCTKSLLTINAHLQLNSVELIPLNSQLKPYFYYWDKRQYFKLASPVLKSVLLITCCFRIERDNREKIKKTYNLP